MAETRSGSLTIYSADRTHIYGEFADGTWRLGHTDSGENHVFSGTASDGTMETFQRINSEGISHVAFTFETNGERYTGDAQFLRPEDSRTPGQATILIETGTQPVKS